MRCSSSVRTSWGEDVEYREAFAESLSSPDSFWGRAAEEITWHKKWDQVLDT
ncbi:MAG: hypothetical protein MUP64_10040, partial [Anaerolineae bacterium]|nr:hypothetical protein [Anaerolineae bacterium]